MFGGTTCIMKYFRLGYIIIHVIPTNMRYSTLLHTIHVHVHVHVSWTDFVATSAGTLSFDHVSGLSGNSVLANECQKVCLEGVGACSLIACGGICGRSGDFERFFVCERLSVRVNRVWNVCATSASFNLEFSVFVVIAVQRRSIV